jgi:hypothetical protein
MTYSYFKKVATFFKNSNLVDKPVNIRRSKLKGLDGICEDKNDKFVIKVNQELSENHSIDVLIHEFAHAVAWDKDVNIHGPNWGKAYSKVYCIFLENFVEKE